MTSLIASISQMTISQDNTQNHSQSLTTGPPNKDQQKYSLCASSGLNLNFTLLGCIKICSDSYFFEFVPPVENDPKSDVTFCSSDGDMFHLQRKYLEANTGAFPGSEFDTCGEITYLTETSLVLHLLFQFVYPRREPDIEGVDFDSLAALAEAAEKYEVFHAMTACKMQMKSMASKHPIEILLHASRHDYPALLQEVVPYLIRKPIADVARHLPNRYVLPWIRYRGHWDAIFDQISKETLDLKIAAPNFTTKHSIYFSRSLSPEICSSCLISALKELQCLKEVENISELKEELSPKTPRSKPAGCLSSACQYVNVIVYISSTIKKKMDEVPLFSTFICT